MSSRAVAAGARFSWLLLGTGVFFAAGGALAMVYLLTDRHRWRRGADMDYDEDDAEEVICFSDIEDEEEVTALGSKPFLLPLYGRNSRQGRRRQRRGGAPGMRHPHQPAKKLLGPHVESFPKEERLQHITKIVIHTKEETFSKQRCKACWLLKRECLCEGVVPVKLPIDFNVWLHYKEYLRISNTGHLLTLAHPGSRLLVEGREADDARLAQLEAAAIRDPFSVVALMPCAGALSVAELKQKRREHGTTGRLQVILLDGTWRQARALNRRVSEKVVRVKVEVADRPTVFRLRQRTRADGISTIEAALWFIEDWGGGGTDGGGKEGVKEVLRMLGTHNERVLKSSGKLHKVVDRGFGKRQEKEDWAQRNKEEEEEEEEEKEEAEEERVEQGGIEAGE